MRLTSSLLRHSPLLHIHPSIIKARTLRPHAPIVSLESTIITHGLPHPVNLLTALECEDAVRSAGAIPATIALLDKQAHIGVDERQLRRLAECAMDKPVEFAVKAGRKDIAHVLAEGCIGGTTVSGTMALSRLAGIEIFATGGVGGVHRGAETSFDISSDLTELGRTRVALFCSGAKSILDIPLTLEYLETQGVQVASFGTNGEFPAFYTAASGHRVEYVPGTREAAQIIDAGASLGLESGMLFGVPIPASFEPAGREIAKAVEQAVRESVENGMAKKGKLVTPWLLKRVSQLSREALASNRALVVNNARVAAETAVELALLREEAEKVLYKGVDVPGVDIPPPTAATETYPTSSATLPPSPSPTPLTSSINSRVVVLGTAALDITARPTSPAALRGTTYPGEVWLNSGGVAQNVALAASQLTNARVTLFAPVGDDLFGSLLRQQLDASQVELRCLPVGKEERTAAAVLSLDSDGDLSEGTVDMDITERVSGKAVRAALDAFRAEDEDATVTVALDANLSVEALTEALAVVGEWEQAAEWRESLSLSRAQLPSQILFEPTSVEKCTRIIDALEALNVRLGLHDPYLTRREAGDASAGGSGVGVAFCTPNGLELEAMHRHAIKRRLIVPNLWRSSYVPDEDDEQLVYAAFDMMPLLGRTALLVKLGPRGVLVVQPKEDLDDQQDQFDVMLVSPPGGRLAQSEIVSTTGAGDTCAGAFAALCAERHPETWAPGELRRIVETAQKAAKRSITSKLAVAPDLAEIA